MTRRPCRVGDPPTRVSSMSSRSAQSSWASTIARIPGVQLVLQRLAACAVANRNDTEEAGEVAVAANKLRLLGDDVRPGIVVSSRPPATSCSGILTTADGVWISSWNVGPHGRPFRRGRRTSSIAGPSGH